jgi:hypothetical protein
VSDSTPRLQDNPEVIYTYLDSRRTSAHFRVIYQDSTMSLYPLRVIYYDSRRILYPPQGDLLYHESRMSLSSLQGDPLRLLDEPLPTPV